jgi:prepilin-type N-terminal cleavage/methylation domain-containing protein
LKILDKKGFSPTVGTGRRVGIFMNRKAVPAGFSLVELIVVVGLMAIVAAVAVPTWQRYSANTDLKTAAREVKSDLFNAKQRAMEENVDFYRMTFNVTQNNYVLSRSDSGAVIWTKSLAALGKGITVNTVNFSGGAVVSFQRRGTMSPGNMTLRNSIGSTATITTTITGRAYVEFTLQ